MTEPRTDSHPSGAGLSSAMMPKFDTAAVTEFWLASSARMMRSGETFMRGMAEVARLEAELGQDLLRWQMAGLQASAMQAGPEGGTGTQLDQSMKEYGSLVAGMRKIAEIFGQAMKESTRQLFELEGEEAPEPIVAATYVNGRAGRRRPEPATG